MFEACQIRAARAATIRRTHAADELFVTTELALPRMRQSVGEAIWFAKLSAFDPDVAVMRRRLAQAIRRPRRFDLIIVYPLIDGFPLAAAMSTARALGERLTARGWLVVASGSHFTDGEVLAVAAASGLVLVAALPGRSRTLVMTRG